MGGGIEGAEDGSSTAHIGLHAWHTRLALDGEAAGVVDDALADPHRAIGEVLGGHVVQDDHGWCLICGFADAVDTSEPLVCERLVAEHGDFHCVVGIGDGFCSGHKRVYAQNGRRLVDPSRGFADAVGGDL